MAYRWEQRVTIKGKQSPWLPIHSAPGISIRPDTFCCVNDIDDNIYSPILKFADDTNIFGYVATEHQIRTGRQRASAYTFDTEINTLYTL